MSVFGRAAAALAGARRDSAVQRQQNAVLERQWQLADELRAQQDEDRQRRQQTEDVGLFRTLMTDPTLSSQLGGAPTAATAPAMAGAGAAGAALGALTPAIGTSPVFAAAQSAVADQATRRQGTAPALADVASRTGATFQGSVADQRMQAHRALDQARPGQYGAFDPNVDYTQLATEERGVFDKARRILASGYTKDASRAEMLARDGIDVEKLNQDRADRESQREIQWFNANTSRKSVDQRPLMMGGGGAVGQRSTEGERRASAILGLVTQADAEVNRLGGASLSANVASRIPLVGGYAARKVDGESLQRDQAGTQFVTNLLYLLSGATASPQEIEANKRIYIPAPGDDATTLSQKAQARQQAIVSARAMAGNAADAARSTDTGSIDIRAGAAPWADVPGFEPPPGGQ